MKKRYIFLLFTFVSLNITAQIQIETIGNSSAPVIVSSYTGWINQGVLTFSGNAEVQNTNQSSTPYSSGSNNVYFSNTLGTYFQVSNFQDPTPSADGVGIEFNLFGYDTTNLNELNLSMSKDSGITWTHLNYARFFDNLVAATPWDLFSSETISVDFDIKKMMFRFTQTSPNKTFRIDDLHWRFVTLLQIKVEDFSAKQNFNSNILNWHASSKSNSERFLVQKSIDGKHFSTIGEQIAKGAGNYQYNYIDELNTKTKIYYRLKVVDSDGKLYYSKIISLLPSSTSKQLLQTVFPIPTINVLTIEVDNILPQNIHFILRDVSGKLRIQEVSWLPKGYSMYKLNTQGLASGIYYLTVEGSQFVETQKIVIVK